MAISNRQWQTIEKRSGVPRHVMEVLLNRGERSAQSSVSPMGAYGRAQLMPATARALERKYKISTKGEFGNVLGGALYLGEQKRAFGSWKLAFAAYNAGGGAVKKYGGVPPYKETQDYVKRTMSALGPGGGTSATPGAAVGGRSPAAPGATIRSPGSVSLVQQKPNLMALMNQQLQSYIAGGEELDPYEQMAQMAATAAQARRSTRLIRQPDTTIVAPSAPAPASAPAAPEGAPVGGRLGKVTFAAGADRAGIHTKQNIINFARQVAARYGSPLTVGTGTNHSQMTVNGNQSQHWTGEAVDIPASGAALTRMGRAALIAAGMPRAQAMKVKGGLFNIGGHQVIFNTTEGGNHWNHLHLGW